MKAQELRIGNYVTIENKKYWEELSGKPVRVTGFKLGGDKLFPQSTGKVDLETIDKRLAFSQFDEFIQPIPLSEEWLLKFGFKLTINNRDSGYKQYGTRFGKFDVMLCIECNEEPECFLEKTGINIKYVHQLQNLFYVLTGTELTIKSTDNEERPDY